MLRHKGASHSHRQVDDIEPKAISWPWNRQRELERELMSGMAGFRSEFESGKLSFSDAGKRLAASLSAKHPRESKKIRDGVSACAKLSSDLAEAIPVDAVCAVLSHCDSLKRLGEVASKISEFGSSSPKPSMDEVESYAVRMSRPKPKREGRSVGSKLGKKVVAGAVITGVLLVGAVVALRFSGGSSLQPEHELDFYRKHSPKTYARVENYFGGDAQRFRAAMNWLDRADGEGHDGRVNHFFTAVQLDDLRDSVITPGYDSLAARKYNSSYAEGIMATHNAIVALKSDSRQSSLSELGSALAGRDLVMVNEAHMTPEHIQNQVELVRAIAASGRPVRVGMELFDKYFNYDLERFMSSDKIGGNYMRSRLNAECTPEVGWKFGQYFDAYRPLFDEMKSLRKRGVDIRLCGIERGYTQQQIYDGNDFYGRDRHMASQVAQMREKDVRAGIRNAVYVTITGEGHGAPKGHLASWMPAELSGNMATIVFGNQPASIKIESFLSGVRGLGDDEKTRGEIRSGNFFYIERGEKAPLVYDISTRK